jgi:hypothetical protein
MFLFERVGARSSHAEDNIRHGGFHGGCPALIAHRFYYGWIGQQSSSGFINLAPSINTALQLVLRPHFLVHFV